MHDLHLFIATVTFSVARLPRNTNGLGSIPSTHRYIAAQMINQNGYPQLSGLGDIVSVELISYQTSRQTR